MSKTDDVAGLVERLRRRWLMWRAERQLFVSYKHWLDNWRYGDWRQYVCERDGVMLQPARVSSLNALWFFPGTLMRAVAPMSWTGIRYFPWELERVDAALAQQGGDDEQG